jgi:hypothetical protein
MNFADPASSPAPATAEDPLRAGLARADRALAAIPPVLGHLVGDSDADLFNDAVVANTRGMIDSLATALVRLADVPAGGRDALIGRLLRQDRLLGWCHSLAVEARLAERIAADPGLDPVLSPLLQGLIGAPDPELAALAMTLLAAQGRFVLRQRRIEVALEDLPADLLHDVLLAFADSCGSAAERAAAALRDRFDEARTREALLTRTLLASDGGMAAALDPAGAGIALFASALALATGIERRTVILSLVEGQAPRLALMLAAAGLDPARVEGVVDLFHPGVPLGPVAAGMGRDHALALLLERA